MELSYEIINGYAIWQGDIILGKVEKGQVIEPEGMGIEGTEFRWPNRTVVYTINSDDFWNGSAMRNRITSAIQHWRDNTDIEFVERTTEANYVEFVAGDGCWSRLGKVGGRQEIQLSTNCSLGTVVHEIGHTVGLYHEQMRFDRDEHVDILEANIQPDELYNFEIPVQGTALDIGSYDFQSIMHYSCDAFSINGQQTIVPLDPPAGVSCTASGINQIGQQVGLSTGDLAAVKLLYTQAELFYSQNTLGIADSAETGDVFSRAIAAGDFNGDGVDDVAIGVPNQRVNGLAGAGAVHVFYGRSGSTFSTATDQFWHQDSTNIEDVAEAGDHFGTALAVGDFNNDGRDDLAIGVPDEDSISGPGQTNAGTVNVLYGTASGLSATSDQIWSQSNGSQDISGASETDDRFGAALATGDFNGDGFDDLAVGAPGEAIGSLSAAGAVNVIRGSANRLTNVSNQIWYQDSPNILDQCESSDHFGYGLAAGDFNNDGRDDLAIGIPGEDLGSPVKSNAGAVAVLYGSASGVTSTNNQIWHQDSSGILDQIETGDWFGAALTAADFNGDGRDDLAIGVSEEDVRDEAGVDRVDAGAVAVLYGSSTGVSSNDDFWSQDSSGIMDVAESYDYFGYALTAADFNGDGRADLAIGVPQENLVSGGDAGAINILFGRTSRLRETMDQFWHQDIMSIPDPAESGDWFGAALAAGDFNGDSFVDLAIGVPFENIGSVSDAGALNVINNFANHDSD